MELISFARSGDQEAFTSLMRSHEGGIQSFCRRFTKKPDDAEDLVLETFVEAYLKLNQLRNSEAIAHWLRSIARNLCRSWYRKQRMGSPSFSSDP